MDIATIISKRSFSLGLLLLILILLATLPLYTPEFWVVRLTTILMFIILTVSWVIFSGPTGYISLASAAFFGVGVYAMAILGDELPLPVVIGIGGVASSILALLVGALTLRLRGIYFIVFTFGLVMLLRHLILFVEITVMHTRGRFITLVDNDTIFYAMLSIFVMALLTAYFIRRSRFGLALQSIGEYEEAAAHTGINVTLVKIIAFAISAFFMGAAGAIMATKWTYIDPYNAFNPLYSFMPVFMAIFGGMGQLYGPVLGAAIFTYLDEILRTRIPELYLIILGIVLVVFITYLPNGLVGLIQRLTQKWWKGGLAGQRADT